MTTPFLIRPIEPRDDAAVAAVIRTVMPEFGASGEGFAIHDAEVGAMSAAYAKSRSAYFVLEIGVELPSMAKSSVIVGGGGVAPLESGDADVCELRKMYFLPQARGIGAGKAMIAKCLETARKFGFKRCYLETLTGMDAAQALYRQHGFAPICAPLGKTGHHGCDRYFILELGAIRDPT